MIKLYTWIVLLISVLGCTTDFEDINTNPNAPVDVQPALLLRKVIYDYAENMSYEGFVAGNLLSQHFTMIDFNLFDRHNLSSPQYGGNPWPILYKNLRDVSLITDYANENPVFEVYKGPSFILKALISSMLTDIYGDVPFTEATKGLEGNINPKYDSQEAIYLAENGIIALLDNGIEALEKYSGGIQLQGDLLFSGDLDAWIRLANSLKIKALVRISAKTDVSNSLQEIYNSGKFMQNNAQNAVFQFSSGLPNNFRMANLRIGDVNLFVMSETAFEIFDEWNDPRKTLFYRPLSSNNTQFNGLLNGPDASSISISVSDYSITGTIFRENAAELKANILTAWETQFLLAEAAERGLISGNAKEFYESGVILAFEYWKTEMPANYLKTGKAAYAQNGENPIEQIITQKWISNTINGYESWIEYRRTGFPKLKTVSASLNNNLIPVRMPYPADEEALNKANYELAKVATNGNSVNAKVWWQN